MAFLAGRFFDKPGRRRGGGRRDGKIGREAGRMRKFSFLVCLLLLALSASAALADDTQFIEHEPFLLDDAWVEGSTHPDEYHYYPFTVEEVGLVTVRAQLFCGGQVQLLDADLVQWDEHYFNGTAGAPDTYDFTYYLEPGTYYLRSGNGSSQGDFRIKGTLEACLCDETTANDDYHGAQAIPSGETIHGVLTQWDEHDYFTFTLDGETEIYLTANSESGNAQNIALYDSDMVKTAEKYTVQGYAENLLLPSGTYYLDVWGGKGPYTFRIVYAQAPETLPANG